MFVIGLRLVARTRKRGLTSLQADDWLTINCIVWYTILIVSVNQVFFSGGSNFMTLEEEAALTPKTIAERVAGSKWVVVLEEAMVLTVWTCKLSMLFIYRRITQGLKQARSINIAFIWVGVGFVGTQLGLFLNCRPFHYYWAVPTSNTQCWSYFNYQVIEACFNISSDIVMLAIAIPILLKLQVPILQKGILLGIFSMGVFIIIAAILTKLFSLYPPLLTYAYLNWYCREASVCVYVTNLPAVWSLVLDVFPSLRKWGRTTSKTPSSSDRTTQSRILKPSKSKDHQLPAIRETRQQQSHARESRSNGEPGAYRGTLWNCQGPRRCLPYQQRCHFSVRRDSVSDDYPVTADESTDNKTHDRGNVQYISNCSAV
ncbi:MAG: hypothetical protein LQ337_004264 [Flavoplaca oasis]|nr:MAG: hypothetical protein LQ337_004264 [Flavoplaca oasis]